MSGLLSLPIKDLEYGNCLRVVALKDLVLNLKFSEWLLKGGILTLTKENGKSLTILKE